MKKLNGKEINNLWEEIRVRYLESSELKNRDKNEIYFLASSTLDTIFIQLLHDVLWSENKAITEIYPPFRDAFREMLVLFGNNPKMKKSVDFNDFDNATFETQKNVMYELVQYNVIRNRLEAGFLNDIEISYDEENKLIITSEESESALIARYEDAEKYFYDTKTLVKKGADHIVAYIMGCEQSLMFLKMSQKYQFIELLEEMHFPHKNTTLFFENNYKSYKKEIQEIINFTEADYDAKSDISRNYDLGKFDLEEYKKIYCCLMVLCLNRTQFCFCELMRNNIIANPNVIWHKDKIIEFIEFFTSIPKDKIKYILETFLVFKNEFQYSCGKEYLSLYQPLFDINDSYVINSSLTLITLAQRKLIWQINKYSETNSIYENTISTMAHEKEEIMIEEINSFLSNGHYDIKNNFRFKITEKQDTDAEIDVSVLDSKQKVLLLIECKDHLPIDNEIERSRQDKQLISEAEYRAEKNKIIYDNLELYMNKAYSSSVIPDKVLSILIANHYGGSNTENASLPIISKATFFKLLKLHSHDLLKVYQAIVNKNFKPPEMKQEKITSYFLDYTMESWIVNNKIAAN